MHTRTMLALVLAAALAAGCGGEGRRDSTATARSDAETSAATPPGVTKALPVLERAGAIDSSLAERGKKLFSVKGCVACHTIGGGKRIGPDLEGITRRVAFPWMYHWITDPDSMLRADTMARRLLDEYRVPMPNQHVSPAEFEALYEYLRQQDDAD